MENEGAIIADWIKKATIINKTALCNESGMDRGNLDKYLLKGEIPSQHIDKIKNVISNYGYVAAKEKVSVKDLNRLTNIVEPQKPLGSEKSNITINTKVDKKNPDAEPAEGTNRFFLKYGVFTHEEAKKLKP